MNKNKKVNTEKDGEIDEIPPKLSLFYEILFVSVFALWFLLFFIPVLIWFIAYDYFIYIIILLPIYLFTSYFTGDESNGQHKRRWEWFNNSLVITTMCGYFQQRFINETKLNSNKTYIIGVHPHGMFGFHCGALTSNIFNYIKRVGRPFARVVIASVMFKLPGIREFFLWQGYCNANRKTVRSILESGQDCAIIIGGSKEVLESLPGSDVLYLKKRKGFVRLALQTGSGLVPYYAFAHNDCYDQFLGFKKLQLLLVKHFQALIPLFYGRWYSMVPYKCQVTMVLGKPIEVDKVEDPTPEQIDQLHEQYMKSVVDLFNKWKLEAGYPKDRNLKII